MHPLRIAIVAAGALAALTALPALAAPPERAASHSLAAPHAPATPPASAAPAVVPVAVHASIPPAPEGAFQIRILRPGSFPRPITVARPADRLPHDPTAGGVSLRPSCEPPGGGISPFDLPAPDSPVTTVKRLQVAYERCLLATYAGLLTADFRFVFGDPTLRERFPDGFTREDEIASVARLCDEARKAAALRPLERRIEVCMDALVLLQDPEHPDEATRYVMVVAPAVRLRVRLADGGRIETEPACHEFYVVRGDAAAVARDAPFEARYWYVRKWIERCGTADSALDLPLAVRAASAKDSARAGPADSPRAAESIPLAILRHPNPAFGRIALDLSLPGGVSSRLDVLDVAGRIVARRDLGSLTPGRHRMAIDEPSLPPGAYWLRLTQDRRQVVSRVVMLR